MGQKALVGAAVCVLLAPLSASVGADIETPYNWTDLFNGEDTTGWQLRPGSAWRVQDGALSSAPAGPDLLTEIPFTDHQLHIEFTIPPDGAGSLYLQGRYELLVSDAFGKPPDVGSCGAVRGLIAPSENAARPAGEWQTYDITFVAGRSDRDGNVVRKPRLTLVWNGRTVIDDAELDRPTAGALDDDMGKSAPLMLAGTQRGPRYRTIRYRPIRVDWAPEGHFIPLAAGGDLANWSIIPSAHGTGGRWELRDGVITGLQDPPGNGGVLVTDDLYDDFDLRVDAMPDWNVDSGLFLRCQPGGDAYEVTVDPRPGGYTAGVYLALVHDWLQRSEVWDRFWRKDQWNEIRTVVTGQPPHIQVWLNGNQTVDYWDTDEHLPAEGHIGLQLGHWREGRGCFTRFRDIRVLPITE